MIRDAAGTLVARVAAPGARDANGEPVPASLSLDGDVLTLPVAHHHTSATYPIEADPFHQWTGSDPSATVARPTGGDGDPTPACDGHQEDDSQPMMAPPFDLDVYTRQVSHELANQGGPQKTNKSCEPRK